MTASQHALAEEVERPWEDRAALLRAIAHPVRLAILQTLRRCPHCVKHLNSLIPIPQPHLSQHMAALRKAELVACHACGPVRCYYLLRPALVERLLDLLQEDHPPRRRDRQAVIDEARQGWENDQEAAREESPPDGQAMTEDKEKHDVH